MKTITILQAFALLLLAVVGAYAGGQTQAQTPCAQAQIETPADSSATPVCDL